MAGLKKVGTTGSVAGFEVTQDNTKEVLEALNLAADRALMIIGMKAEKYAKALCPVGTPESTGKKGYRGGTLRNSLTFNVNSDGKYVEVGSNVEYAPYVELGTGLNFQAPPEWETFEANKGSGIKKGGIKPRHFLRDAIVDHMDEYGNVIKSELGS